jgi:uncharacterized protein YkwD
MRTVRGLARVLLPATAAVLFATPASAQEFAVPASARAAIVSDTNSYRQAKGLAPLRESPRTTRAAQAYADYLARNDKTGHHADGRGPAQRLREAGIVFCKFRGENWHQSWTRPKRASVDAAMQKAMRFWKRSPGHERALRSASTEIGVGVAGWKRDNRWIYVSVQVFIDTSCLPARATLPPLPDRNPARIDTP